MMIKVNNKIVMKEMMMKIVVKGAVVIAASGMLLLTSCESFDSINDNPNDPSEVSPQLLLPGVCKSAFTRNIDGMYADKMVVQTDGHNREQFFEWDRGSYGQFDDQLLQVTKLQQEADRVGQSGCDALCHFFRAYYFYRLTLTFGDVPYSEALQGETKGNYTPAYDTQEQVFSGILDELRAASDAFARATAGETVSGDIIYGGDMGQWQRLTDALWLKVLITLSRKQTVGTHDVKGEFAEVAARPLLRGNADNGQLKYIDQEGNRYPLFNAQWSGFYMDKTFVDRLAAWRDPRLFLYALPTNEAASAGKSADDFTAYAGGDPTVPYGENKNLVGAGRISQINSRYRTNPTGEPTVLLGYAEQQFILAEAAVRGWTGGSAARFYEDGITASFDWYHTYGGDYARYVAPEKAAEYLKGDSVRWDDSWTEQEKVRHIITEKYLMSFFQAGWTPYFDYLRTGYPALAHIVGTPIPQRWMYPDTETRYNTDNVEAAITRQFGANNDKTAEMPWWLER